MTHNYTFYPIIPYIYNELDLFSRLEFEFALEEDSSLVDDFNSLMIGFNTLPRVVFSPKKSTMEKILAYSAKA